MLSKILVLIILVAFVLLSTLIQSTSPATIHPLGILAIFILFYLLALGVLTFLIFGIGRFFNLFDAKVQLSDAITFQRSYYFASVIALAPVLFVGMRSIGRGTVWDVVLILMFEAIAFFYISKRR
jgi:hypothetical protein